MPSYCRYWVSAPGRPSGKIEYDGYKPGVGLLEAKGNYRFCSTPHSRRARGTICKQMSEQVKYRSGETLTWHFVQADVRDRVASEAEAEAGIAVGGDLTLVHTAA